MKQTMIAGGLIHRGDVIQGYHGEFSAFGDDPSAHRWRAKWESSRLGGEIDHIVLLAYPVTRATPCGAWIDPHAYRYQGAWCCPGKQRWVGNDSRSAFAKATREAALNSLRIRLKRWLVSERSDLQKAMDAARLASEVWPESATGIGELMGYLRETANGTFERWGE